MECSSIQKLQFFFSNCKSVCAITLQQMYGFACMSYYLKGIRQAIPEHLRPWKEVAGLITYRVTKSIFCPILRSLRNISSAELKQNKLHFNFPAAELPGIHNPNLNIIGKGTFRATNRYRNHEKSIRTHIVISCLNSQYM